MVDEQLSPIASRATKTCRGANMFSGVFFASQNLKGSEPQSVGRGVEGEAQQSLSRILIRFSHFICCEDIAVYDGHVHVHVYK